MRWFHNSIDLVVSARAGSLFDPEASRKEFRRILRPPAWFAIVNNYRADGNLNHTFPQELSSGFLPSSPLNETLLRSHFFRRGFTRLTFPLRLSLSWQDLSDYLQRAPNRINQNLRPQVNFETQAREIFNCPEFLGEVSLQIMTELYVGQL